MKKLISFIAIAATSAALLTAQVLPSTGVRNTLSTSIGTPFVEGNYTETFHAYGFIDTLQARVDVGPFTMEGMLNWGALTKWTVNPRTGKAESDGFTFKQTKFTPFAYTNDWHQGNEPTNAWTDDYYVNFLWHPIKNIDIGVGTRLNWIIGPAPTYGGYLWESTAHAVQGGLKDGNRANADVVGYAYYPNCYARKAIGFRFVNKYVEAGVAIPDGASTNSGFYTNFGLKVTPVDWLSISAAFEGNWSGSSNFYTGAALNFDKDFALNVYLGLKNITNNDNKKGVTGTGASAYLKFPGIALSIRPEIGFTFYENENYTPAWYTGCRGELAIKPLTIGCWVSGAWGSADRSWYDERKFTYSTTKDYTGGFILELRPDITFEINKRHSLSSAVDFQMRTRYDNRTFNAWAGSVYWTYKY